MDSEEVKITPFREELEIQNILRKIELKVQKKKEPEQKKAMPTRIILTDDIIQAINQ